MKNFNLILVLVVFASMASCGQTGSTKKISTLEDSMSYAYGSQIAQGFKKNDVAINPDMVAQGIKDALAGNEKFTSEQVQAIYMSFDKKQKAIEKEKSAGYIKEGEDFLAENAKKEGVETTESGLQIRMIEKGTGPSPVATDKVTVHYTGRLMDGTVFDSSVERGKPATFGLNRVIPGWTEGLQLIKEGGKAELVIPSELGYGERESGSIPAHSVLIFEVELIKIEE